MLLHSGVVQEYTAKSPWDSKLGMAWSVFFMVVAVCVHYISCFELVVIYFKFLLCLRSVGPITLIYYPSSLFMSYYRNF